MGIKSIKKRKKWKLQKLQKPKKNLNSIFLCFISYECWWKDIIWQEEKIRFFSGKHTAETWRISWWTWNLFFYFCCSVLIRRLKNNNLEMTSRNERSYENTVSAFQNVLKFLKKLKIFATKACSVNVCKGWLEKSVLFNFYVSFLQLAPLKFDNCSICLLRLLWCDFAKE